MATAIPAAAGWHTVAGRRPSNQDAVLAGVLPDGRELIAVADGMGGHRAGEVASQSALETLLEGVKAGHSLASAVAAANRALYAAAQQNPEFAGMGTTLVALLRDGNAYQIANVGDSRAYRIEADRLEQITADHTFIAEAVSQGELSEEEAQRSRWRNALTRAVGTDPDLEVDVYGPFGALQPHAVVLCSDGFHGSVPSETLLRYVADTDPQEAAKRLTDEAYRNGSKDNITVAVVTFGAGVSKHVVGGNGDNHHEPRLVWPVWRADTERHASRTRRHSGLKTKIELILVVVLMTIFIALLTRIP